MDTAQAFARGAAARAAGARMRVFDWDKAARLIAEHGVTEASAGLSGDWEWTGGRILKNGQPVPREDTYTYLASNWAIPELSLMDDLAVPCWRWKDEIPVWDAETYWPESALAILRGGE